MIPHIDIGDNLPKNDSDIERVGIAGKLEEVGRVR